MDQALPLPITMPQGKAISEAIQWIIVRLNMAMSTEEIAMYTDLSERKVRDIIAHFQKTGDVNIPKCQKPTLHWSLQDDSIQVQFTVYSFLFFLTILNYFM